MRLDLAGRAVVVTGAAGGLGTALSTALVHRGARVALLDVDHAAVEHHAATLGGADVARGWAADVRDLEGLRLVLDDVVDHFGGIDVVVAGAGVLGSLHTLTATDEDEWERVVDINLSGVWRTFKAAAPHVSRRRGHLLAMSSMIAYVHPPLLGGYAATKAGVAALCDVTRLELRPAGVTVGSAHPVIFRTPMISDGLSSPAAVELVDGFSGVFKTVALHVVVDDIVRGIERRSPRVVSPRAHRTTTLIPGLVQAILERLAFRPRTIRRAIELGAGPAHHPTVPTTPDPTTAPATTVEVTLAPTTKD